MTIYSVQIEVIPHKAQRYDTVGDWQIFNDLLVISVSDTGNWVFNMAIGLHELVEALLCIVRGIDEKDVSKFDIQFEKNRVEGNDEEPGDHPDAPYHLEHGLASAVERMFIASALKNWKEYESAVDRISEDGMK
jgi:hypothetical protein